MRLQTGSQCYNTIRRLSLLCGSCVTCFRYFGSTERLLCNNVNIYSSFSRIHKVGNIGLLLSLYSRIVVVLNETNRGCDSRSHLLRCRPHVVCHRTRVVRTSSASEHLQSRCCYISLRKQSVGVNESLSRKLTMTNSEG